MKERPIIFTAESVRAILDGPKTQTRRTYGLKEINRNPDNWDFMRFNKDGVALFWRSSETASNNFEDPDNIRLIKCPYGQVGDRLWVRETFVVESDIGYDKYPESEIQQWAKDRPVKTEDGGFDLGIYHLIPHYRATEPEPNIVSPGQDTHDDKTHWKPSIHLPRWASRIERTIKLLRAEQLRDISEADAKAEGGYSIEEFITLFIKLNHLQEGANPWNWVIGW